MNCQPSSSSAAATAATAMGTASTSASGSTTTTPTSGSRRRRQQQQLHRQRQPQLWGWRQRFSSPDHFVFNAFIVLVLASGLIVVESFQFFFCYLANLDCLDLYSSPPAAILYGSGLIIGVYLLLPGVLCLVAARRAPGVIETAMWTCIIGIVLVVILLATTVFEVSQYARLVTRSAANRGKHSVNLLMCLACITLGGVQLAFLAMETCVCRGSLRCQRKGYRMTSSDVPAEDRFNYDEDGPTSL